MLCGLSSYICLVRNSHYRSSQTHCFYKYADGFFQGQLSCLPLQQAFYSSLWYSQHRKYIQSNMIGATNNSRARPYRSKQNSLPRVATAFSKATEATSTVMGTSFECFQSVSLQNSKWMVMQKSRNVSRNVSRETQRTLMKSRRHQSQDRYRRKVPTAVAKKEPQNTEIELRVTTADNNTNSGGVRKKARGSAMLQRCMTSSDQGKERSEMRLSVGGKRSSRKNNLNLSRLSPLKPLSNFAGRGSSRVDRKSLRKSGEIVSSRIIPESQQAQPQSQEEQLSQSIQEKQKKQQIRQEVFIRCFDPVCLLSSNFKMSENPFKELTKFKQESNEGLKQPNNEDSKAEVKLRQDSLYKAKQQEDQAQEEHKEKSNQSESIRDSSIKKEKLQSNSPKSENITEPKVTDSTEQGPETLKIQVLNSHSRASSVASPPRSKRHPSQLKELSMPQLIQDPIAESSRSRPGKVGEPEFTDPYFDPRPQLTPHQIVFITIPPSQQTALFPSNLKPLRFVKSTPTHRQFSNPTLISFLNFLLAVDPKAISSSFQPVLGQGYRMRLYDQLKPLDITIDPVFPFDVNLYPLIGFVQQYIWPSVLFKCLAKLKGSYSKIKSMSFVDIFGTLTNKNLLLLRMEDEENIQSVRGRLKKLIGAYKDTSGFVLAVDDKQFYQVVSLTSVRTPSRPILSRLKDYSVCVSRDVNDSYSDLARFLVKEDQRLKKGSSYDMVVLKGIKGSKKIKLEELMKGDMTIYYVSSK